MTTTAFLTDADVGVDGVESIFFFDTGFEMASPN